jgi:type II secretory pathway pseudopilin PulG
MNRGVQKRGESGFALLLVFLMAAIIGITLYTQIPRVAFQAQRQKEQLLIERGEQYKRAIQLFFRANNRYPAEIKDLENFNNRRFLRHKFIDPMTGKDDWRLVHINNGVLTDSVLNKKKPGDPTQAAASTSGQYVGEQAPIGGSQNPGQQSLNPALYRRRASDGGASVPQVGPDGQPVMPGQPISGIIPGQPVPGQPSPFPSQVQPQPFPGQPSAAVQTPFQPFAGAQPNPNQVQAQPFPIAQPNPNESQVQPFPGAQPNPNQFQAQQFPGMQPNPNQIQAQPFPGVQPNPGAPTPPELGNAPVNPLQQIPGRLPGFTPGGAPPNNTSQPSSSYVGGSQSYVGSSGPYVGGGAYIGSSPTTVPTMPTPGSSPFTPGQVNPTPVPAQPNFPVPGTPFPPGGAPTFNPGQTGQPGQNPAANMINNILMNPRGAATGQPGVGIGQPVGGQPLGQQIGGGIAGIASKSEDQAIMVYNDKTNYNEWEFIFDPTKQPPLPSPLGGSIGTSAASLGTVAGSASPLATPSPTAAVGANPAAGLGASPIGGATPAQGANQANAPGAASGAPTRPAWLRPGKP